MNPVRNLNILFVSINNIWRYPNTGVDQLVGYLRSLGYNIDIKYYHNKETFEDITKDMNDHYDFIGLSVHSANYNKCCMLSTYIKEHYPNTYVAWGGYFPTMYYREILEEKRDVDALILGDGEVPTADLLAALSRGEQIIDIPSVITSHAKNGKHPYANHLITHLPAFDYYEKDTPNRNKRKIYCLQTKNNVCTGKCSFCTERKGAITHKSVSLILEEIQYVVEHFGMNQFFITDDNIMDPNDECTKAFIKQFCYGLKALNYKIAIKCYIKANSFKDCPEDHELLELMSSVGFASMFVGIEAGNTEDLKLYNKLTTVEDNHTIIRLLRQHDIEPIIGFIHINPYSTLNTLKENFEFLIDIESGNLFQYAGTVISLQRYTALYSYLKRDNLLVPEYTYLNNMVYKFANQEVQELVTFVLSDLRPRIVNLDMEIDTLLQTYSECARITPAVYQYKDELLELKKKQMSRIKEYFTWLYIDHDLEKCKAEADNFLIYFENEQRVLMKYYWIFTQLMFDAKPQTTPY